MYIPVFKQQDSTFQSYKPKGFDLMTIEKVYTSEEVAEMLKVDIKSVQAWLRKGHIGGIKLGKIWRITETDLNNFIEEGRKKSIRITQENKAN